jgi:hypothetical protein
MLGNLETAGRSNSEYASSPSSTQLKSSYLEVGRVWRVASTESGWGRSPSEGLFAPVYAARKSIFPKVFLIRREPHLSVVTVPENAGTGGRQRKLALVQGLQF